MVRVGSNEGHRAPQAARPPRQGPALAPRPPRSELDLEDFSAPERADGRTQADALLALSRRRGGDRVVGRCLRLRRTRRCHRGRRHDSPCSADAWQRHDHAVAGCICGDRRLRATARRNRRRRRAQPLLRRRRCRGTLSQGDGRGRRHPWRTGSSRSADTAIRAAIPRGTSGTSAPSTRTDKQGMALGSREFLYGGRARSLAIRLHDRLNPSVLVAAGAAVVAAATMGLLFLALPHTSASPRERGLAFRALIASQTEQAGVDTPARANRSLQISAPRIEPAWPALRAERASSDASRPPADDVAREESSAPAPAEAPQRNDQASNEDADRSARQTVEQVLDKVRTARQAADEAGEETLGRLHTAQQVTSSPPEAPDQATIPTPDVREQQIARELIRQELARKPGTAQKAAEPTGKEAPNWQVETKRTKPVPAQTANAPAQRPQVTNTGTQGPRDCAPSQPTGQIVCRPPGKKGSPAKASASAQAKQQRVAAEAAAERSPKQQQIDLQPTVRPNSSPDSYGTVSRARPKGMWSATRSMGAAARPGDCPAAFRLVKRWAISSRNALDGGDNNSGGRSRMQAGT